MDTVDMIDLMDLQYESEEGINHSGGELGTTFVATPISGKTEIE